MTSAKTCWRNPPKSALALALHRIVRSATRCLCDPDLCARKTSSRPNTTLGPSPVTTPAHRRHVRQSYVSHWWRPARGRHAPSFSGRCSPSNLNPFLFLRPSVLQSCTRADNLTESAANQFCFGQACQREEPLEQTLAASHCTRYTQPKPEANAVWR
jgi:hypothetical protein